MKLPRLFLNGTGRLRSGWWIAIFFLLLAALLAPFIVTARDEGGEVPLATQALIVALASIVCQCLRRKPLAELFGAFNVRWPRELAGGIVIGAALMLAPALALLVLGSVRFAPSAEGLAALAPGLALFAVVAVTEELMFRGFVFQRLLRGLGEWPAQSLMGGLFLRTHSDALRNAGGLGYLAGANIFSASVMFGLAFIRTRSLALPLGLHFGANFMQGSVFGFGVSGSDEAGWLRPSFSAAPDWLTGGAFGLEASAPGLVFVLLTIALLLRWRRVGGVPQAT